MKLGLTDMHEVVMRSDSCWHRFWDGPRGRR